MKKAERRKHELQQRKQKNRNVLIGATITILALATIIIILSMTNNPEETFTATEITETPSDVTETQITIPLSHIKTEAKFYTYESNDVDIRYFAVIGSDGEVHVATDACDLCYEAKRGYKQENDVMKCINCGLTFPIDDIGDQNTGGGCWPSYIPISITDENLIIEISDLEAKRFMFA
jgi:uncharacterized membrane protein